MQAWVEIITHSKPPVPFTPLSPYMPLGLIEEHGVAMNGTRVKSVGQFVLERVVLTVFRSWATNFDILGSMNEP